MSCASRVSACRGQPVRRKSFADKQNNSERLLNDPVLKIKNAQPGKGEETKKRQQLVAPFHEGDVGARASALSIDKRVKPLVDLLNHRQSARYMAGPVMLIIRDGWGINPGGREQARRERRRHAARVHAVSRQALSRLSLVAD